MADDFEDARPSKDWLEGADALQDAIRAAQGQAEDGMTWDEDEFSDAQDEPAAGEKPADPLLQSRLDMLDALYEKQESDPDAAFMGGGDAGLAPYMDAGVAEEVQEAGPPAWLGTRWRDIRPEEQAEAWIGLRRWVDWLVAEFRFEKNLIPACWFRHPQIVAELHAAMNMEYKVWEEGAPTLNPMLMWLPHVQQLRLRLREVSENLESGCKEGTGHTESKTMVREYDEDLWAQTIGTTVFRHSFPLGSESDEPEFMRARFRTFDGEDAETTAAGNVPARPDVPFALSGISARVVPGDGEVELVVTTTGDLDGREIVWETAPDREGPWADAEGVVDDEAGDDEPGTSGI